MNEKLNIQNLIELLAEKHGMDKADAESICERVFSVDLKNRWRMISM